MYGSKLASNLYIRPNFWTQYIGFAQNSAHTLAASVRHSVEKGTRGFDFDGGTWNWGTQGLDFYVLVNMMWNPWADVDGIIEDYCNAAYGAGATQMLNYHNRLEQIMDQVREDNIYEGFRSNPEVFAGYYSEEVLAELQGYIDAAKAAVGDESSKDYKRIHLNEEGLEYTRLGSRLLRLAAITSSSDPAYQQAKFEFFDHFRKNLRSYSVNAGITGGYAFPRALGNVD